MGAMASQITSLAIFLIDRLFRYRSKKTSKLHVTGLCAQMASNAPIPLGCDLFPTMPTSADLGTYAPAATIGKNVPSLYSDYAIVTLDTL